jgi:glycosyltransferase involved in cell wall biosynthesis
VSKGALRIGVVVPARDEARTIEAKLANLAECTWLAPCARGPHAVVVVDDGSRDDTAARAERAEGAARLRRAGVRVAVIGNGGEPGKPGAIRAGLSLLAELGFVSAEDLVVLSDADVVCVRGALLALAAAFEREARLGMACGAQRYIADGGPDSGAESTRGAGPYDRAFGLVRRLESRAGALLSVHGQLLAWRASLELAPPDGRAADDLELVVAARDRRSAPRVRLVRAAEFMERRAPGAAGREQVARRARAWFQHFGGPAPRRLGLRLQWHTWRLVPHLALALTAPCAWLVPSLRARRAAVAGARAAEREAPLAARWEVVRG